jgi:hypothetical protein
MKKLDLNLSQTLTQHQKVEAYFDSVNNQIVIALVVNPAFYDELKKEAGSLIKSSDDAIFADSAKALTFDGVQLFIKDMKDDFKLIQSEEEFKIIVQKKDNE